MAADMDKRAEIYTYECTTPVYAMNWSVRSDLPFRLAVGSLLDGYANQIKIISLDNDADGFTADPSKTMPHPFAPTKLAFLPDRDPGQPDLLASSSDVLRLWRITDGLGASGGTGGVGPGGGGLSGADRGLERQQGVGGLRSVGSGGGGTPEGDGSRGGGGTQGSGGSPSGGVALERALRHTGAAGRRGEFAEPVTSFDWNPSDLRRIAACSLDTTCTIWDVERGVVDTQLIAHDREVYDVAWGSPTMFASVSSDGSVRVFDLRDKEHSTITYESPDGSPLVRLAWNHSAPCYMAALALDDPRVAILDVRYPATPVATLARHAEPANAVAWAPHSPTHVCSAADDGQALIWDLAAAARGSGPNGGGAASSGLGTSGPNGGAASPLGGAPASDQDAVRRDGQLDPILAYGAGAPITQLQWSAAHPDWVAVAFENAVQVLRV